MNRTSARRNDAEGDAGKNYICCGVGSDAFKVTRFILADGTVSRLDGYIIPKKCIVL